MDLWIRSQDKMNLVKVNQINVNYQNNKQIIANTTPDFYNSDSLCYELLGTYETKERALEVLDEIQDILKPKRIIANIGNPIECSDGGYVYLNQKTELEYQQIGSYVYEMPEK